MFYWQRGSSKNPVGFIEIVDKVKKNNPKITACMIGDGELMQECAKKIKDLNLEQNIEMLGFKKNPFPIIKNCKICVMPSLWEGFGITAIESLILEKPVFNSGVGGLAEIFKDDRYFICNKASDYIEKIMAYKKMPKSKFSNIYDCFTDKRAWTEDIRSMYD